MLTDNALEDALDDFIKKYIILSDLIRKQSGKEDVILSPHCIDNVEKILSIRVYQKFFFRILLKLNSQYAIDLMKNRYLSIYRSIKLSAR